VLKSNISACHLKLEDWKEAVKSATEALDGLDRLKGRDEDKKSEKEGKVEEEEVDEIVSEGAMKLGPGSEEKTNGQEQRMADIERIRAKALMRRAKARSELGGWSVLSGAEEGAH
jgi:hypothetical protein